MKYAVVLGLASLAVAVPAPDGWEKYTTPAQAVTGGWGQWSSTQPAPTTAPAQSWNTYTTPVKPTTAPEVPKPPCTKKTTPATSWTQWTTSATPVIVTSSTSQGWNTWVTYTTPVAATTTPCTMTPVPTTSSWAVWTSSTPVVPVTTSTWQQWETTAVPVSSTQWETASVPVITKTPTVTKPVASFTGAAMPTAVPQAFGAGLALVAVALVL